MRDRGNMKLNELIEQRIDAWRGTPYGVILRDAYKGSTSYEGLCEIMGLDPDEYMEGER